MKGALVRMKPTLKLFGLAFMLVSLLGASTGEGDMCAVESAVVHHMRPAGVTKSRPIIREIAVEDGYAVALWLDGYAGGTATLKKKDDTWIVLALGGGWDSASGLVKEGVPKKDAERLAKDVGMGH